LTEELAFLTSLATHYGLLLDCQALRHTVRLVKQRCRERVRRSGNFAVESDRPHPRSRPPRRRGPQRFAVTARIGVADQTGSSDTGLTTIRRNARIYDTPIRDTHYKILRMI
jgi:hypothetical protein